MSSFYCKEELNKYEDVDEDELLASLTSEELQELEREMAEIDPDENTPIGLRQRDHTAKQPTGPFCREALLKHWQNETIKLQETDISDCASQQDSMDESQTDKSEEECLSESDTEPSQGTLQLLNNKKKNRPKNSRQDNSTQVKNNNKKLINSSQPESKNTSSNGGIRRDIPFQVGLNLNVKPEGMSKNPTDIDGILEKILRNDQSVSEVNLNNIDNLSQEMLISFAEALTVNTHVQVFSLANTHADDHVAFALAKTIKNNYHITSLNVESNFISGRGILALIRSLQQNTSLVELRFQNQRHICGGQVEMEMVKLLRENTTLLKLGYQFELPGPRTSATSILTRNQDRQRQTRLQLQRQKNKKSEETMLQTTHTKRNGAISIPKNRPDNKTVTISQETKNRSLPKPKPQLLNGQTNSEKNGPTRNIAETVKFQKSTDKRGINKHNMEKVNSQTKEKESADVLKDMIHALKPPSKNNQEDINGQRSVHGDLMAAIRSNHRTLNRVGTINHQIS